MDKPNFQSWTPSDAAGVNEFLHTPLGQKFMTVIHNHRPRIDLASTERAALTGAYSYGYELCLLEIYAVCRSLEQPDVNAKTADMIRD